MIRWLLIRSKSDICLFAWWFTHTAIAQVNLQWLSPNTHMLLIYNINSRQISHKVMINHCILNKTNSQRCMFFFIRTTWRIDILFHKIIICRPNFVHSMTQLTNHIAGHISCHRRKHRQRKVLIWLRVWRNRDRSEWNYPNESYCAEVSLFICELQWIVGMLDIWL